MRPLTQFPPEPYKDNPIEAYQKYKGLREIVVEKGSQGWGIMIIEGKHAEAGTGVFVSGKLVLIFTCGTQVLKHRLKNIF